MANTKISELLEAGVLDGLEDLPIVQDGVTVRCSTQDIADLAHGGVKTYKVLLSYNGSTFSAVSLQNTLGGNPTITAPTANTFRFTLTNAFPVDKVFVYPTVFEFGGVAYVISAFRASDSILTFKPYLLSDGTQPVSLPSFTSIPIHLTVNP